MNSTAAQVAHELLPVAIPVGEIHDRDLRPALRKLARASQRRVLRRWHWQSCADEAGAVGAEGEVGGAFGAGPSEAEMDVAQWSEARRQQWDALLRLGFHRRSKTWRAAFKQRAKQARFRAKQRAKRRRQRRTEPADPTAPAAAAAAGPDGDVSAPAVSGLAGDGRADDAACIGAGDAEWLGRCEAALAACGLQDHRAADTSVRGFVRLLGSLAEAGARL